MRQLGTVTSVLPDGVHAQVAVQRMSACEGCHRANPGMQTEETDGVRYSACHECSMFPQEAELSVEAENFVGAETGDRVVLESETKQILGYAAAVFVLPIFASAVLGMLGALVFVQAWAAYLLAVLGFCGSFLFAKLVLDRHAKTHTVYSIVKIL